MLRSIEGNLKDCVCKLERLSFKNYFDLVESSKSHMDELQKSNKDLYEDLINYFCDKKELLDAL